MQASTISIYPVDKKVIPIVPYSVKGKYRNMKTAIMILAYTVYFAMPWMVWHGSQRVGQPLLFDIANERFYLFDLVVYPQDLMLLVAMMVMAACLLFIVATFYGRIFCGFFCFQTIWTDAFRMIEGWIQGEAQARQRLMKQPWHLEKIAKLLATYSLWFLLSLLTAITFALYFAPAPQLLADLLTGQAAVAAYVTVITLTSTTYFAAGIAKEDICRVACPYGKFQSVMQDPMTKTVNYDQLRGERQKGRIAPSKTLKNASERNQQGYGDCTDCGYCVNACPTGVDIRQGFQIDCISCGLCIDACDSIMRAIKLPTGLIRFNSAAKDSVGTDSRFANRVKKLGYMTLLILAAGFIGYQIQNMTPYTVSIQQQAQPLVTRLSDGSFKSRYVVRISNKTDSDENYEIKALGLPKTVTLRNNSFAVPSGKSYVYTVDVILNESDATKLKNFQMTIKPQHSLGAATTVKSRIQLQILTCTKFILRAFMSNIQIIPINKKCQDMILSSGQRLQLVIETMFNVKIYDDRICVINMKFHPLTSLNNPELSPRYKMISSAIETELIHGSHQDISKIAMDFFCVYTGGSIQNALA